MLALLLVHLVAIASCGEFQLSYNHNPSDPSSLAKTSKETIIEEFCKYINTEHSDSHSAEDRYCKQRSEGKGTEEDPGYYDQWWQPFEKGGDKEQKACKAFQAKYGDMDASEVYAVRQYTANEEVSSLYRKAWRKKKKPNFPESYNNEMYRATHLPNRAKLWEDKPLVLWASYNANPPGDAELATYKVSTPISKGGVPEISKLGSHPRSFDNDGKLQDPGVGILWGPWSTSISSKAAFIYGMNDDDGMLIRIEIPKGAVTTMGALDMTGDVRPHLTNFQEGEVLLWDIPTKYITYFTVKGKGLTAYEEAKKEYESNLSKSPPKTQQISPQKTQQISPQKKQQNSKLHVDDEGIFSIFKLI